MSVFRTFSAPFKLFVATRGDALRACPWLSYPAPLALPIALAHSAFGAADRAGSFRLWALSIALAHSALALASAIQNLPMRSFAATTLRSNCLTTWSVIWSMFNPATGALS